MTKQLKPWQSFQDHLENLVDHGLLVDNPKAALNYLQRIGYYRLSGYWYPMRVTDKNRSTPDNPVRSSHFIPGSHFEDAVRLYVFDKKLRLLALDALERIEMALRVDIAHLLGKLDPLAHENPSWLNSSCLHGNFTKQKMGLRGSVWMTWRVESAFDA
jgi:abortive infection bacteriophage resistance protein